MSPFAEEELELNVEKSKEEAKLMMCGAVEGLLRKTGVRPDQIVVVVTACSVFNTMPSLSSTLLPVLPAFETLQTLGEVPLTGLLYKE